MHPTDLKKNMLHALERNDLDVVAGLALKSRHALSQLIRISYDKETLVGWRAIKSIGLAARSLAHTDDETLRITIRKLLWSLSDESGGIGWSAPEILGEIVSADPEKFSYAIPLIVEVFGIEERVFRPGVVYALKRIGEVAPERVAVFQELIAAALLDRDPLVKVYALELVEMLLDSEKNTNIWSDQYIENMSISINKSKNAREVVWVYKDTAFIDIQVGEKSTIVANYLKYHKT